jgi:hypothetical protein
MEVFEDEQGEWQMLAVKAKTWLKQQGVDKPDTIVRKMDFDLI